MIIAGTGGLGREVLGMLVKENQTSDITFFDENTSTPNFIYEKFPVIKSYEELKFFFESRGSDFIVAIGHPRVREKVCDKIINIGGKLSNAISLLSSVFPFNEHFEGCIIQPGAGVSHGVKMGKCCAIHINSTIGHNVILGNYVNISPGVTVIGPCEIGDYSYISAQAVVMPNVKIGKNCIIQPCAFVNNNIPDFSDFSK